MKDHGANTGKEHKESFETLLRLLASDRDQAGEKYEHLRRQVTRFFQWNFCYPAEDLADETFERLEQRIAEIEISDVVAFFWGIAKHIRQEANKKAPRTVNFSSLDKSEDQWPDGRDLEKDLDEQMQRDRRRLCLGLCLKPEPDRRLFLAYHEDTGPQLREELAKQAGLTLEALRTKMSRLRDKLERCARTCFASTEIRASRGI